MRTRSAFFFLSVTCFGLGLGCASDSEEESEDTAYPVCDTGLEVTWLNWGEGFLLTHCSGCHSSEAPERHGAPEGVNFDTEKEALDGAAAIVRVVLEEQTMPPAGGIQDDEMALLEAWLSCFVE